MSTFIKTFITLCLCSSLSSFAFGQSKQMFSGKVVDQTSSPVANATLHVLNTNLDVLTNEEGEFVIATFLDGSLSVEVSATGFATIETTFNPEQNQHIIIRLSVVERQLDEVIVTA